MFGDLDSHFAHFGGGFGSNNSSFGVGPGWVIMYVIVLHSVEF